MQKNLEKAKSLKYLCIVNRKKTDCIVQARIVK